MDVLLDDLIAAVSALRKLHNGEKPLDDYVSELRKIESALDDIQVAAS